MSALDCCSIIETLHIMHCSTEDEQFLALSIFFVESGQRSWSLNRTMKDLLLYS